MTYRIGWITNSADPKVASVRIRCLNIINYLGQHGTDVSLYEGDDTRPYEIIIFSKAYSDQDIALATKLKTGGSKIIFDLCDNHFLLEEEAVSRLKEMLKLADFWVSSTEEMARIIVQHMGAQTPIKVIGDAVETRYDIPKKNVFDSLKAKWRMAKLRAFLAKNRHADNGHLVWFGNHSGGKADSGMAHLSKVEDLVTELAQTTPLTLTVISNSKKKFNRTIKNWAIPTFYCEWHPLTFFDMLKAHDIAIIPIKVNDFTRVKSNNRIALPLSLGVNVVADSIDSYREFGDCAYLDNWREGILNYARNDVLRKQHLIDAQKLLASKYSIEAIGQQWQQLFAQIMTTHR